jgi:hypothetical protein
MFTKNKHQRESYLWVNLLIVWGVLCLQLNLYAQGESKSILILGDSHMKGYFGEFFHKKLHSEGRFFILNIAIGGAGTKTFTHDELRSTCCGYRVRYTCPESKLKEKDWIPVLESSEDASDRSICRVYGSTLDMVLQKFKPDLIIIALGSNYYNAHFELMRIVENYKINLPFVWVGPYNRQNVDIRYSAIEKVMENRSNGILVRSDDILGSDTLTQKHFVGKTARYWAYTVVERMKPFIDSTIVR